LQGLAADVQIFITIRNSLILILSLTHADSFSQNSNTFAVTKIDSNGEKIAF